MADIFDQYEADYQASIGGGSTVSASPLDAFEAEYQASIRPTLPGEAAASQIGKGLSFGYFDELQGVEAGLQNLLANVLGRGNDLSFSENYQNKVNEVRGMDTAFQNENPIASIGLQVLGGVAPALATGGASATGTLPSLLKNTLGIGLNKAPSIWQLGSIGATSGALAGSGEAVEGERLKGGLVGGTIGGIAGPAIGTAVKYGGQYASDKLANLGVLAPGRLAEETGSINFSNATKYTPEEIFLAKQLKNTPLEKIAGAADELANVGDDVPLFLPEALQSPKVDRNARFIANYEPSMEFAQDAINLRTQGAEQRGIDILGSISNVDDTFAGSSKLTKAAREIFESAETQRMNAASPLYKEAYEQMPLINSANLDELLSKDQVLTNAIKQVQKTANNADLPVNSSELLVKARQEIGNQIDAAITQGSGRKARDLTDTYNRLNNILHENPYLATADEVYSKASQGIEELNSTFLKTLANLSDDKVTSTSRIFNLPANRIESLRETFKKAGKLDEWNAGIRSHLQNVIEANKTGQNFADDIIGNTLKKDRLKAAIGENYEDVVKRLSYENRMAVGKNKYHIGSSTAPNLQEAESFKKSAGILNNLKQGNWTAALGEIFSGDMDEDLAKKMAEIYFSPSKGKEAISKILPLLEQYQTNKELSRILGTGVGTQSARQSATSLSAQQAPQVSQENTQLETLLRQQLPEKSSKLEQDLVDETFFNPTSTNSASQNDEYGFITALLNGDDMKPKDMEVIEEIKKDPIDYAIMMMESAGNPEAKNPKSSASGLFQLIKQTAGNLGVKNVFDARENYEGYKKLKAETIKATGRDDVLTIYASHYLGLPTLKKWMNGESLTETQLKHVEDFKDLMPRLMKFYKKAKGEDVTVA